MTSRGHKIRVKIDKQGVVEVGGMTRGQGEAREVASKLGLGEYEGANLMFTVIRSAAMGGEALAGVRAKAVELGFVVEDVEALETARPMQAAMTLPTVEGQGERSSTIAALHAHKMGPTGREKLILPLVMIGVVALLLGVGSVVRDHMNHGYHQVATLGEVVALADAPPASGGGLAGIFNPDDSQFASLPVRGWPWWNGKTAVLDDHYIQIPDLLEPSIETLVKGDRGGASVVILKFDARGHDGSTYRIDVIERGGLPTKNENLDATIIPLAMGAEPSIGVEGDHLSYADGARIRYDRDPTFRGMTRVALPAWVVATESGPGLWSEGCSMALTGEAAPGVSALMADLTVQPETLARLEAGELPAEERIDLNKKKLVWFMTLEEVFPWREGSNPGRRQLTREVGAARMDGVLIRKLYIKNATS